jgi:hypothetical protein
MKKIIITVILMVCFGSVLSGQEERDRKYSFQIKPFTYVIMLIANGIDDNSETYSMRFEIEFQYAISNHINLSFSPYFAANRYRYYETDEDGYIYNYYTDEYIKDISYGILAGVLYRPWGNKLKGMYIGLYPLLSILHVNYNETHDTLFNIGIMLESGYQWVIKNGFTLAYGGGIGFSDYLPFPDTIGEYKKTHFLNYPFDLSIRISLGYSF